MPKAHSLDALYPLVSWVAPNRGSLSRTGGSSRGPVWAFLWVERWLCQAGREKGSGLEDGREHLKVFGRLRPPAGLPALACQSLGTRPAWQGRSHVSTMLLFLAGSWDIMTALILETLFKAREIARFGEKNTTSSNFISTHGNYSNRDL